MSSTQIEQRDDGTIFIRGALQLDAVNSLFHQIDFSKYSGQKVRFNLSAVEGVDSAGLALCLHWISEAEKQDVKIIFQSVPAKMLRLASMNQLEDLFCEAD